jgi:hypothetical protein
MEFFLKEGNYVIPKKLVDTLVVKNKSKFYEILFILQMIESATITEEKLEKQAHE